MNQNYQFTVVTDLSNESLFPTLTHWADCTRSAHHTVPRTPQWLINNLELAVIVTFDDVFIAAGGVKLSYDDTGEQIIFEQQKVCELCSNFVSTEYRSKGIGKRLVLERLSIIRKNDWIPVIVTREPQIMKLAANIGMLQTTECDRFAELGSSIRDCSCQNQGGKSFIGIRCEFCPINGGKTIWVLPPEVRLSTI